MEAIVLKHFSIDISEFDDDKYIDFVKKAQYIDHRETEKWAQILQTFFN